MLGEVCYREMPLDTAFRAGLVEEIDPMPAYFETLRRMVDFDAIARSGLTIAYNPLYGAGRGYVDTLLREAGVKLVTVNDHRDPYFGGMPPEPSASHMGDFITLIRNTPEIGLGLATDGDADRYGIVDADGGFIEPNYILALLFDYLVRVKKRTGNVARSVATSHLVDAVAKYHGLESYETPVGFKYIGEFIRDDKILLGGEESAGLTVRSHVPDKDGILTCLLVAEMVAVEGRPLKELLADLYRRVGEFHTVRENLRLSPELVETFAAKLAAPPKELAGKPISKVVTIDGSKFLFDDGSWVLFRKSGTEPVVRIYGEAASAAELERLMKGAVDYLKS